MRPALTTTAFQRAPPAGSGAAAMAADPLQELGKQAVGETPDELGPDPPRWKGEARAAALEAVEPVAFTLHDGAQRHPESLLHFSAELEVHRSAERKAERRDGEVHARHRALLPELPEQLRGLFEVDA